MAKIALKMFNFDATNSILKTLLIIKIAPCSQRLPKSASKLFKYHKIINHFRQYIKYVFRLETLMNMNKPKIVVTSNALILS